MSRPLSAHLLRTCARSLRQGLSQQHPRKFSVSPVARYDGVYKELSAMKLQKPWLQALSERNAGIINTPPPLPAGGLEPKRMKDSFHKLVLPLAKDKWLVDGYVNASGQLRLGTLFQDLDALAGVVAYKHTGPGPTTVTAAVDRISIIHPLEEFCDLELSGFVSYVGKSSMEISLEARRNGVEGEEGLILTCAFTMVALNPQTKRATPVPPLVIETPEEKAIFNKGEEYQKAKKALRDVSLAKQTPNDEESDLIHQMWMEQLQYEDPQSKLSKPENTSYMSTTTMASTSIMQPQYRNRHSFMIFGGYLLKSTMELAFCCTSAFAHSRPTFLSLDPSTFDAPVPVGSILYLTATVAYTEPYKGGSRVQVRVGSKVRDVEHGSVVETGVFNYSFFVEGDLKVMPRTYGEFVMYVDARRRAKQNELLPDTSDIDAAKTRVME
ncbi:uncharacterized protein H6S33_008763 [Morchella sextelata]|uniref:uncharacterized protein n=1 Tax=Morchella sextelata TaxID=1174677 RepID=UPI001D05B5E9|nr:uncharacterized protein H6S33_008763 [Morchella sextelata]KAH0602424.1 hypothetical protein H6S33_008763 [Morchella sextelata]